jgi:hypothetical protein
MADAQLSPTSYLKHALRDQHNVVLLLGAACFSVAFASPVPLFVGAGLELLWLSIGPRLPGFRAWIDRQLSKQYLARAETAIGGALTELSEQDARRFLALSSAASDLLSQASALSPRELLLAEHGMLELRRTFLDYLFLNQRVQTLVDPTPIPALEKEAARLQEAYGAERDLTARMTIRQALNATQKRISEQAALAGVSGKLEVCLDMLEKALVDLARQPSEPGLIQLAAELDTALAAVGPAEALELSVDEIFPSQPASSTP